MTHHSTKAHFTPAAHGLQLEGRLGSSKLAQASFSHSKAGLFNFRYQDNSPREASRHEAALMSQTSTAH
eukprot:2389257-Amphidinium_carterae.1